MAKDKVRAVGTPFLDGAASQSDTVRIEADPFNRRSETGSVDDITAGLKAKFSGETTGFAARADWGTFANLNELRVQYAQGALQVVDLAINPTIEAKMATLPNRSVISMGEARWGVDDYLKQFRRQLDTATAMAMGAPDQAIAAVSAKVISDQTLFTVSAATPETVRDQTWLRIKALVKMGERKVARPRSEWEILLGLPASEK